MSWRTRLALLVGLLLPLPVIVLVIGMLQPRLPETSPGGRSLSPMLSNQDRLRLSMYHRDCARSSECGPPLGCILDSRKNAQYCSDSECLTDAQCPEALICRSIASYGDGPLVRFCISVGSRQEGEECIPLSGTQDASCIAGLLCGGGLPHTCGRPCRKGDMAACPADFFCADTTPQPICRPTCEVQGCPTGQRCIRFDEGVSLCEAIYGPDCQQTPCFQGRKCEVSTEPTLPGKAWMECVQRCGEGLPPCGAGRVCDIFQCKPECTPQAPDPCGEGYHCIKRRRAGPYACQPLGEQEWDQ